MPEIKWDIQLSVTESNNIGEIKPRQNNSNSEVIRVKLTRNSEAYDLTALKVFFVTYFPNTGADGTGKPVQKAAKVIDAKKGIFEFVFDNDCMYRPGRQEGYFEIYDYDKYLDATQRFYYVIQNSARSMKMDPSASIDTWKEAEKMLDQGTAKVLSDKTENLELKKADKRDMDNLLSGKTDNTTFVELTADLQRQIESTQSGMIGEFDSEDKLKKAYPDGTKGYAVVWFTEKGQKVGYSYTYKNKYWVKGQVFNGAGLPDRSVTPIKTTFLTSTNNLFNWKMASINAYITSTGDIIYDPNIVISDYIKVTLNSLYSFNQEIIEVVRYDSNRNYIDKNGANPFNSLNAVWIRLCIKKENYKKAMFNKGQKLLSFENGDNKLTKGVTVNKDNLELFSNEINFDVKTKIGYHASMILTGKKPNIDSSDRSITFFKGTYFLVGSKSVAVTSDKYLKLTAQHHYIYLDLESKEIKVFTTMSALEKIEETHVYICYVSFLGSESSLIDVVDLATNYSLDNQQIKHFSEKDIKKIVDIQSRSKNTLFSQKIPNDDYEPVNEIQDFSAENHYVDLISENVILGKYDDAVSNGWGKKIILGNDSSDAHPIYKYEFRPEIVPAEKYNKQFPKIIITTCTHGEEKMGAISLANFIKDVSDNYKTNELLKYVKNNVHLIIIPILNSYGFKNFKRKNANGVDINRNSSYRWATSASSDPSSIQFKGTAPFSEKENQYVRDLILENKDATAFFDYHMNGTSGGDGDYIHNFWHYIEDRKDEKGFEELNELSIRNIMLMTERSHEAYDVDVNSGWVGMINYNSKDSSLAAYAYSEGIPGFTIECLKKLQGENVVYSKNAIKISTEFIGNHIINVCRSFLESQKD
ncbi:DUF2817 domain-containing protein [Vagococcus carniphilus]|uniref:DUF2817 domain-containing protein n=1 Tax=Vagococcus carniphilus TaxID=218144 RepID=UPI002890A02B|nr:DUF2817 domain-containing protein [Vagococcus carniphilus]MDT2850184.1 DUF2817 domain-containing protein [Vagococcus carniphilus]